jgi:hypothetical protein
MTKSFPEHVGGDNLAQKSGGPTAGGGRQATPVFEPAGGEPVRKGDLFGFRFQTLQKPALAVKAFIADFHLQHIT